MGSKSLNQGLGAAKKAKQDEFYTQYVDIQKEGEAYLEFDPGTFRGKVVYCNCDDPFESNSFKYFATNFNKLGLKRLITTSYAGSPIAEQMVLFSQCVKENGERKKTEAVAVILDHVNDEDGDGAANIDDVQFFLTRHKAAQRLQGDGKYGCGDFRSAECAISTGRRGAAAGARFQSGNTHRQMPRAPRPQKLTGDPDVRNAQAPVARRALSAGSITAVNPSLRTINCATKQA